MDALSLVANIIAVANATKTAISSLKKLYEARSSPCQVAQLLSETTDTQAVLLAVQRIVSEAGQQPFDPVFNEYLGSLVRRAMGQLEEIGQLVDDGWIRDLENVDDRAAKVAVS